MKQLRFIVVAAALAASSPPRGTHAEPIDQHFDESNNCNGIGDDDAPSKPVESHIRGRVRESGFSVARHVEARPRARRLASQPAPGNSGVRASFAGAFQRIWTRFVRLR
jgi:hypothetical protein